MAKDKVQVATGCLAGCSGCHMSFLDNDEFIIDLLDDVDILASHMIVDTKEIPEVDVGIVEGSIANEENVRLVREIRERSDIMVAWGDCACLGGIMTMRNFLEIDDVLEEVYRERGDRESEVPSPDQVPRMLDKVGPVDEYVDVDVFLPGCPPSADLIRYGLEELLAGRIPKLHGEQLQYN
ncbi:MAG: NADH:ubiquinone oxidoreductase [Candidatus Bipolaricaulota bacterium]